MAATISSASNMPFVKGGVKRPLVILECSRRLVSDSIRGETTRRVGATFGLILFRSVRAGFSPPFIHIMRFIGGIGIIFNITLKR
jgi:hypothetical protein